VLLDVRPGAHDRTSFERAVEACASVASALDRAGRPFDVMWSTGTMVGAPGRRRTPKPGRQATAPARRVNACPPSTATSPASRSSTLNTTYGPQWLQPSLLQDGRMVQFSALVTF
jgi:hypothetical protein